MDMRRRKGAYGFCREAALEALPEIKKAPLTLKEKEEAIDARIIENEVWNAAAFRFCI